MAEQWKALALSETQALNAINAVEQPLGPSFANASTELHNRRIQLGVGWQEVNLDGPSAMLREASREFARYNELHNRFVRVFSIYGRFLGVLADGPLWQRDLTPQPAAHPVWRDWVQSRADAHDYINLASQRRRAVAVYDLATGDAYNVALSFPEHSPNRDAWMRAADALALKAEAAAVAASHSDRYMCHAVNSECYRGMQILNR